MKRLLLSVSLAIGTVMLLSGTPSFAVIPQEMHVNIPFPFRVEGRSMPAGRYLLVNPSASNVNMIEIRSENGSPSIFVLTQPLHARYTWPRRPDLIFERINGVDYLAQIWAAPGSPGNAVPLPGNKILSTQAAMHNHPTQVSVAG